MKGMGSDTQVDIGTLSVQATVAAVFDAE